MRGRHAIDLALDLARMPALARAAVAPPLPPNVIEIMRIAAESQEACQEAASVTGKPVAVLVEAARFCLQQLLFRPDADYYRILGVEPGVSRETARSHMRLLLQWLHPDRNDGLEAVYAERVLRAWRQFSASETTDKATHEARTGTRGRPGAAAAMRVPWIKYTAPGSAQGVERLSVWFIPLGIVIIFLALWVAANYWTLEQATAAILRML